MIYKSKENNIEIQIFNKKFILNNIKRAKIIINNKQYKLKGIIKIKNILKLKIKFLDNIFYLNSMFEDNISLSSIYHFQHLNTKYLKTINDLFAGCSSLIYIDDISNWNTNNINDMSFLFYG